MWLTAAGRTKPGRGESSFWKIWISEIIPDCQNESDEYKFFYHKIPLHPPSAF